MNSESWVEFRLLSSAVKKAPNLQELQVYGYIRISIDGLQCNGGIVMRLSRQRSGGREEGAIHSACTVDWTLLNTYYDPHLLLHCNFLRSLWMMTTHKTRSAVIVHSKNYRRGCYYCYLTIPYHHCCCCWQFNQPHVHISRISSSLTIIIPQITSRAHFCHCWASFSSFAVYSMGGWMDQSIFVFRVCLSHLKIPFNNM